ncbi:MAG: nucleotidyltransferase domain-containing protein [Candidatus Hydrothermarchaeota archaeon]
MSVQAIYERVVEEFSSRVLRELGDKVDSIIVYGSVARKNATKESDIDILIISDEKSKIEDRVSDIRAEIDLEYDTLITLIYLTPKELEHRIRVGSPFIEDVLTQGVVLYDNGTFKRFHEKMLRASR